MKPFTLLWLISAGLGLLGCSDDSIKALKAAEPSPVGPPSYQREIAPLLATNCNRSGCHNGSNRNLVDLRSYQQVRGRATEIRTLTRSGDMPPSAPLSPGEVDRIDEWVSLGAPNN